MLMCPARCKPMAFRHPIKRIREDHCGIAEENPRQSFPICEQLNRTCKTYNEKRDMSSLPVYYDSNAYKALTQDQLPRTTASAMIC